MSPLTEISSFSNNFYCCYFGLSRSSVLPITSQLSCLCLDSLSFQLFYSVFGVVGGPVVGVFCLGIFTRRAHARVSIALMFFFV